MKQVFLSKGKGAVVEDIPAPVVRDGGLLVRTVFSLISPGTEKASLAAGDQGILQKAAGRPDLVKKIFESLYREGLGATYQKVVSKLSELTPVGYSSSGIVEEVGAGVEGIARGDRVACAGAGYASHAQIVFVPKNLCVRAPDGMDLDQAAFATLGAIALQGVRQSGLVLGEGAAVIGLGLVGLLTVQILRAGGIRVLGLDITEDRVALARELGAEAGAVTGRDDPAGAAKGFTRGQGVDAVSITAATPSSEPVDVAGALCRDRGRVVVVGDVGMQVPRGVYYGKELTLSVSRSYGPGRYDPRYEEGGIDYPPGYVRWTERRNMEEFLALVSERKVNVTRLISHRFPLEEAPRAYDLLSGKSGEPFLGILLTYNPAERAAPRVQLKAPAPHAPRETLAVGFIGAGAFALGVLLPALKKIDRVLLRGVANASGPSAKKAGERFGFEYCTGDYRDILNDTGVDAVFIGTRHGLHATLAMEGLRKGKAVFMEKPMALNATELTDLMRAWRETGGRLMVGFNRRLSPLAVRMRDFFSGRREPLQIIYRVNAGYLPGSHWVHDPREGGGRIVGEVCHFVDVLCYLTGSRPVRVFAESIGPSGEALSGDNVSATLRMADGSWGTIAYIARGDASVPKERIEAFSSGTAAVLTDYRELVLHREGREKKVSAAQDKGHASEIKAFVDAVRGGGAMPLDAEESAFVTAATFCIVQSLTTGAPVDVAPLHD